MVTLAQLAELWIVIPMTARPHPGSGRHRTALVVEMADTPDLKSGAARHLGVRCPPSAPITPFARIRSGSNKSMTQFFNGDVSSVGRALDCDSKGHRFESGTSPHFYLTLAQLEERDATNVEVAGSIPAGGSIQGTCRPRAAFP